MKQFQLFEVTRIDWETPREVFDPLDHEFGFTLDVAASEENAKAPRFFTIHDDGLGQSWAGETCWMNPPYGRVLGAWVAKAHEESTAATVVGLLPVRTDTAWWWDHIFEADAEIRFIRGRLRYPNKRAAGGSTAPFPSAIVIWRPR